MCNSKNIMEADGRLFGSWVYVDLYMKTLAFTNDTDNGQQCQ